VSSSEQSDGHFEWDDHGQTPNPEKTRSRYVLFGSSPSYSIIKLWCSGHTGNPDSLVLYELDNAITLILQSDAACGIDTSTHRIEEGMSKGGIWLLVTVPLLVAVYFLVGCIINHRRGIRGVNKIPHAGDSSHEAFLPRFAILGSRVFSPLQSLVRCVSTVPPPADHTPRLHCRPVVRLAIAGVRRLRVLVGSDRWVWIVVRVVLGPLPTAGLGVAV